MAEAEIKTIKENILPKVNEIHTLIKDFHGQEINGKSSSYSDIDDIVSRMENV